MAAGQLDEGFEDIRHVFRVVAHGAAFDLGEGQRQRPEELRSQNQRRSHDAPVAARQEIAGGEGLCRRRDLCPGPRLAVVAAVRGGYEAVVCLPVGCGQFG